MELKAGRELDALVAEKVMGWSVVEVPKRFGIVERHLVAPGEPHEQNTVAEYINGHTVAPCLPSHFLPHYSTDIADAWQVVEKLKTPERAIEISSPMGDPHWCCQIFQDGKFIGGAGAETAAAAICYAALAALKAVANAET